MADFSKIILLLEIFERGEPFIHPTIFIECLLLLFLPACGGKVEDKAEKVLSLMDFILLSERKKEVSNPISNFRS